MDLSSHTQIIVYLIFVLIFISALISASEVAFFSIKKSEIAELKNKKVKEGIKKILSEPEKLLSTLLISNNFVNVFIVILSPYITNKISLENETIKILFQIIVVTSFIILFGEIIPKIYASKNHIKFSIFILKFVIFIKLLLTPINNMLYLLQKKIVKSKTDNKINRSELYKIIKILNKNNTPKYEKNILKSIISLSKNEINKLMTPRVDIEAIEINKNFSYVLDYINKNKHSRIPIYEENLDKIIGILYVKDIIKYLNENENFEWNKLIRKPYFIPENKKSYDLLNDFREKKIHMAIVVDEYGGTSGIITLEDLIEIVVGDILDEFDSKKENLYTKISDREFIFKGKIPITDFIKILNIEDDKSFEKEIGEVETLAGFILEKSGKIPEKKQKVEINNLVFEITNVNNKKINEVFLRIKNEK